MNPSKTVEVISFRDELAHYFEALNRDWIERYFIVEEADLVAFRDPFGSIVEPGGEIFFVVAGVEVFGTCAVVRHEGGVYELAKMAVSPLAQGRGYGDLLIKAAIAFARRAGALKLMLLSNSRLRSALRLYEKHDFRHVPVTGDHHYARVDVQMELDLMAQAKADDEESI